MISIIKSFLLDHKSAKQIIAKNTFWLAAAEVLTRALKFFLVVFAARILGATDYGKFSFALAFAMFFTIFSDLGLGVIVIREFSRDKFQERFFPALLFLKIILAFAVTAIIFSASLFVSTDPSIRVAIWILAIYLLIQSVKTVFYSFFHARQRMEYVSFSGVLEAAFLTALGFFLLFTSPSVESFSWAYVLSALITLAFVTLLFSAKIAAVSISISLDVWKKFLVMSFPVGLVGLLYGIFGNIDSITLGLFGQITQVGWYNVAYSLFNVVLLPATVVNQVFTPVLSRAFKLSGDQLQKAYNFQMEAMIFLGFGFLAGGIALSAKIIDFMYDSSYFPAIFAMNFLLPAAVFLFLAAPLSLLLIACGRQKEVFIVTFLAVIVNIVLDLILIPSWSLYGPALATFAASAIMFFLFIYFINTAIPIRFFNAKLVVALLGAGLAALLTYFFLSVPQILKLYAPVSIFIGGMLYFLVFFAVRIIVGKVLMRYDPSLGIKV